MTTPNSTLHAMKCDTPINSSSEHPMYPESSRYPSISGKYANPCHTNTKEPEDDPFSECQQQ